MPSTDPPGADPDDRDRREDDLARRGREPPLNPWIVVLAIILLAAVVYVLSAILV